DAVVGITKRQKKLSRRALDDLMERMPLVVDQHLIEPLVESQPGAQRDQNCHHRQRFRAGECMGERLCVSRITRRRWRDEGHVNGKIPTWAMDRSEISDYQRQAGKLRMLSAENPEKVLDFCAPWQRSRHSAIRRLPRWLHTQ